MKVAVEIQPMLDENMTGVGWYTDNLVRRLKHFIRPEDTCYLLGMDYYGRAGRLAEYTAPNVELRVNGILHYGIYRRLARFLPYPDYGGFFRVKADLFHFVNYQVPPRVRGRIVNTVYDMVYKTFPETMERANYRKLERSLRDSCGRADAIITISENSKRELMGYLGVPEDKIHIIPPGVDLSLYKPMDPADLAGPAGRGTTGDGASFVHVNGVNSVNGGNSVNGANSVNSINGVNSVNGVNSANGADSVNSANSVNGINSVDDVKKGETGVAAFRAGVVGNGAGTEIGIKTARIREKYGLPEKYLLYLGTIEPRKNIPAIIRAFHQFSQKDREGYKLVVAGKKGWMFGEVFELVKSLNLEEKVIFPGYVAEEDKPRLYAGAEVFLFPSLYEGFGMPPLEAMACGIPVITSNTSSLPEVVGDAGIQTDPMDVGAICSAIRDLTSDPDLWKTMAEKGLKRAKAFTWEDSVKKLLDVYAKLA